MDSNYMGLVSDLFFEGDDKNGYAAFIYKANQGDPDACLFLVMGLLYGDHKEEEGKFWLQKGIEFGSEECQILQSLYDDTVCACEPLAWFRLAFLFESLCMEHSKEMIPLFIRLMNRYPLGGQGTQAKEVCLTMWKRTGDDAYMNYFLDFCSMAVKVVCDTKMAYDVLNKLIEQGYEPAKHMLLRYHLKGRWCFMSWEELLTLAEELEEDGFDVQMEKAYILCALGRYREAIHLYWNIYREGDKRGHAALLYLYTRDYGGIFDHNVVDPLMEELGDGYQDELSRRLIPAFEESTDHAYRMALKTVSGFFYEKWGNDLLNEAMLLSVFNDYPYMEGTPDVRELITYGIKAGLPNTYALRYMYDKKEFPFNGGSIQDLMYAASEADCPLAKMLLIVDSYKYDGSIDELSLLRDLVFCPNISFRARLDAAVWLLYKYGYGIKMAPIVQQVGEWAENYLRHKEHSILRAVYFYTELFFFRNEVATHELYKLFQFEYSDGSIELLMAVAFDRGFGDKLRLDQVEKLARCGAKKGHPLAIEFLVGKLRSENREKAADYWERKHAKRFTLNDYREALRAVIGYNFPDGIR